RVAPFRMTEYNAPSLFRHVAPTGRVEPLANSEPWQSHVSKHLIRNALAQFMQSRQSRICNS
ncbi:MAG: hypothetical protein J6Y74_00980, partial [Clostridia bacterium]|nr:hypothetical protein [Clostridia bacterium]